MDFLRIRQKANERARAREQAERPADPDHPERGSEPALVDSVHPERGSEGPAVEGPATACPVDSVRPERGSEGPAVEGRPAMAPGPSPANEDADPLDDFFWREDETAPRLPDLVAASELPVAEPPPVRREWLTFRLGAEEYALEIEHVREVLKPPPLTEVPRAPAHILGVIMVRGEVIAVIDPRARLGLPRQEPGPRARVLVCDAGEASCGVLVDSVSHVIRLTAAAIEPRPPGVGSVSTEYIIGIGRDRNRLVILLDALALLGDAASTRAAGATP